MAFIGSSKHIFVAAAATAAITAAQPAAAQNRPAYLANFPNFEPKLTPGQLPGDVDTALQKQYEGSKEFAKVQRVFDLWSWQAFVSLNWPTDDHGHRLADAKDTSEASPAWTLWTDSTDIFLPKGAAPAICAKPAAELALSLTRNTAVPVAPGLQPFTLAAEFDKRKTRLLGNICPIDCKARTSLDRAKTENRPHLPRTKVWFRLHKFDRRRRVV
jgi:hypothetical protein